MYLQKKLAKEPYGSPKEMQERGFFSCSRDGGDSVCCLDSSLRLTSQLYVCNLLYVCCHVAKSQLHSTHTIKDIHTIVCVQFIVCVLSCREVTIAQRTYDQAHTHNFMCAIYCMCVVASRVTIAATTTHICIQHVYTHTAHMNYMHICAVTFRVTIKRCRTIVIVLSRLKPQLCGALFAVRGSKKKFLEIKRIKRCPLSSATRQNVSHAMFDLVFFGNQVP